MNISRDDMSQFEPEYPTNTVVGVFEDPEKVKSAVSALEDSSVDSESIDIACNEVAEQRLEEYQEDNPLKAKIVDFLLAAGEESEELNRYDRLLDEGHFLMRVQVDGDEQAEDVARIIHEHDGRNVNYFSRFTVKNMLP